MRDDDTTSTVTIPQPEYPISFEDCESLNGHCFAPTHYVLTSNPPQYPEVCKHCGATRTGIEQPPMSYTLPHKREPQ